MDKNKEQELFDAFVKELKALPAAQAPQGLADEVLRVVRAETAAKRPAQLVSFRPLLALAAMLLIAVTALLFLKLRPPAPEVAVQKQIRFEFISSEAASVCLVGDFNNWNKQGTLLQKDAGGKWFIEVALRPGVYQYQFLIDGTTWTPDPENPVRINDGFGGTNSGLEI